jgi:DNA-binding Xre family transcriptional regulator
MREDPMKTEIKSTFLDRILDKLRPSDLQTQESRLAIKDRVEHILTETGLTAAELGSRIRKDIHSLRSWLSGTRDLTVETLNEFCQSLHISLGDLVLE